MTHVAPHAIDLFCGLGGWTEGLLAEGYRVTGFDIEAHEYGDERYPGDLVLQDVRTLHGAQFADAALIVASPPCQEFSYMAMPWKRAKQIARALRGKDEFPKGYIGSRTIAELTALFDACFRIQREASAAAGLHIPMVVENVRGAIPWVGRARWNFGSYYLWGDVLALMPPDSAVKVPSFRFDGSGRSFQSESVNHTSGRRTAPGMEARFTSRDCGPERSNLAKMGFNVAAARALGDDFSSAGYARSEADKAAHIGAHRKAASAKIAKIPFTLSSWIARTYKPHLLEQAS